ncbi:OmpA family protein [Sphingomicrobium sp. XHP0239]|uniref:OmpA family protein n=1 Tax=Sphingomicrobium maritimum TaxID=3133972 RepID=UPI0031CC5D1D
MRAELKPLSIAIVLLALAACDGGPGDAVSPEEDPAAAPDGPPQSIIREDVRTEVGIEDDLDVPMELTVGFGDGETLGAEAVQAIEAFMGRERVEGDEPITLFGHSDSIGSDEANERASRERAEVVADYLEELGVDPDRMTIVALGEHNPVAPNLMLDGGDDEAGQARNRRVEIVIGNPAQIAERRAAETRQRRASAEGAELDDDSAEDVPGASSATSEPRTTG